MFKPSFPPLSLTKTRTLSEIESDNAFVIKFEFKTDKFVLPNDIDPAPAKPKTFMNPLLSHLECSFLCFSEFKYFLLILIGIQVRLQKI